MLITARGIAGTELLYSLTNKASSVNPPNSPKNRDTLTLNRDLQETQQQIEALTQEFQQVLSSMSGKSICDLVEQTERLNAIAEEADFLRCVQGEICVELRARVVLN